MFPRRRLTMKNASPPPSIPAVHNVLPEAHPATQTDPGKDDYKTGDPSSWAEDPRMGPYADTPPPSTPGYEEAGREHPAAKKAAEEAAVDAIRKKATKAIRLVEGMADKTASQDDMQNAALRLLDLPETQLDATIDTLSKLGFFTAEDDDMDMDPMASQLQALEEQVQSMKSQMGMPGLPMADDEMMLDDEMPMDDEIELDPVMASDDSSVDAMYQAMVQEEAMRLAGKAAEDHEDEDDDGEMDEEATKKAGALALKIVQLKQAMEEDDDDSDEGKEAKKAAAAAIAEAEATLAKLAGKKSELPPEFLENQKGKDDDDDDDKGKEASEDGDADASDDDDASDDGDADASDEEKEAAKKAAAEAEAAAALAASMEQGTSPDEAIVLAHNEHDPMGLAGAPDIGNDDVLSLLFKSGSDDDDLAEVATKAASQGRPKAASGPRPQPRNPRVGPDTLGSLVHTASTQSDDVSNLSSIWETRPDVSDHFA